MDLMTEIYKLAEYGVRSKLIDEEDRVYIINRYLELYGVDEFMMNKDEIDAIRNSEIKLTDVLENLTDIAYEKGMIKSDGITQRDLFDTKLMGILTARPKEIIRTFQNFYQDSPEAATNWFYEFSQNTNYIRRDRIKKDRKWKIASEYGDIDITINLSKPEKDPKAIAAARNATKSSYPACQLCIENEGYAGRIDHPARQNHRIIPVEIQGKKWGFQYSPYVYYNEHCIVFNGEHTPMKIDENTFIKLFDFVKQFPHYFVGSNADLPIVGGSILSHDHFQGGHYTFAMEIAPIEKMYTVPGYEDVEMGIVKWPLSVLRLRNKDEKRLIKMATHILSVWRGYMGNLPLMFLFTGVAAFGMGPWQGDMNAVIAECSQYTYYTKGKRVEGTMYSCTSLGVKLGGGLGVAVQGWLLEFAGYNGKLAVQPDSAIHMLQTMYLWLPVMITLIITFIMSRMKVEKANEELRATRKE